MPSAFSENRSVSTEKNIGYYDEIAINYDTILDQETSNEIVRKRVEEKFTNLVQSGYILDFGGGTGRDLGWLIKNNYQVIFCEPSEQMRKKAIDQSNTNPGINNITFLKNDQIDFTNWHFNPPFSVKLDAILSNFAVINCISDIELLFKNLALFLKPGGHLLALMLNNNYKKSRLQQARNYIRRLISGRPSIINIRYNDHKQTVYVYSAKEIVSASKANFNLSSSEPLFEFTLFHFIKK